MAEIDDVYNSADSGLLCPLCRGHREISRKQALAYVELLERNAVLRDRMESAQRELSDLARSRHVPPEIREKLRAVGTRMITGAAYLDSPAHYELNSHG